MAPSNFGHDSTSDGVKFAQHGIVEQFRYGRTEYISEGLGFRLYGINRPGTGHKAFGRE